MFTGRSIDSLLSILTFAAYFANSTVVTFSTSFAFRSLFSCRAISTFYARRADAASDTDPALDTLRALLAIWAVAACASLCAFGTAWSNGALRAVVANPTIFTFLSSDTDLAFGTLETFITDLTVGTRLALRSLISFRAWNTLRAFLTSLTFSSEDTSYADLAGDSASAIWSF